MTIYRSRACDTLICKWYGAPKDSAEYQLARFAYRHNDFEVRDELIRYLDEDPADSDEVRCARELWPLLLLTDPAHDPADLRDELAVLVRDQQLLQMRMEALAAKFRAIEPHGERWTRYPHDEPEFGDLNIEGAARELGCAARMTGGYVAESLADAQRYAAKLRVYTDEVAAR